MTKWQMVKLFFTSRNARKVIIDFLVPDFLKLLFLFFKITYHYITKKYLRESSVIEDLSDTFQNTTLRVRPLTTRALEDLERLTFAKATLKSSLPNATGAYWYGTDDNPKQQSSTIPDIWWGENNKEKENE